jgi:hypothetical protein
VSQVKVTALALEQQAGDLRAEQLPLRGECGIGGIAGQVDVRHIGWRYRRPAKPFHFFPV